MLTSKKFISFALIYIVVLFLVQKFTKKADVKDYGTVVRIDNKKLITNKPVEISNIELLSLPKMHPALSQTGSEQRDEEFITMTQGDFYYVFSPFYGTLVECRYINPATKEEFVLFNHCASRHPFLALSLDEKILSGFVFEKDSLERKSVYRFTKKTPKYEITKTFEIKNSGSIIHRVLLSNFTDSDLGLMQLINYSQISEDTKEASENISTKKENSALSALTYNPHEKVVNFYLSNPLVLDQSLILEPRLLGVQNTFFTSVFKTESFARGYLASPEPTSLVTYLDCYIDNKREHSFTTELYVGPKLYTALKAFDERAADILEYGIFAKTANFLITFLLFIFSYTNNLGLALLFFMLLIKLLQIPLIPYIRENNKKNKEYQQKLDYVKAKYHNDKEKRTQEEFELMRQYGFSSGFMANFSNIFNIIFIFALGNAFKNNILFYNMPIGLWLSNATLPDPLYILPIFLFISMYFTINSAKKITPMIKIALLLVMVVFTYFFSFWSSATQLFVVITSFISIFEKKYLV